MLDKIINLKKNHIFFIIIISIFFYLTGCKPPSPKDLTVSDPEVREKTAIRIVKTSESNLKVEENDIPELLPLLKDESKYVRLATLKVLKIAEKESTIPEMIKLFSDNEEEVREMAVETVAKFGKISSKYVTDNFYTLNEQEDLSEVEKEQIEKSSIIALLKIDEFEPIFKNLVKLISVVKGKNEQLVKSEGERWIKIGLDYYEKAGDEDGLEKLASYYLEIENYKEATNIYEKLGKTKEGYLEIADEAFKKMNYMAAALYYEKAGDKEKAAESRKRIIKDGQWTGDKIKFTVASKGRKIIYMEVTIPWRGGRTTNYIREPIEIKNNSFSYDESRYSGFVKVEGKFTSAEKAVGSASFSQTQHGTYGQSFTMSGSTDWVANFKNKNKEN